MNVNNINEVFIAFERYIKAGLIHVALRTNDDIANATEGELIVDYSHDPKAPVLKVIKEGVPEFVYTQSDELFREFKKRAFQVGTEESNDGYSPSVYFKINNGTNDNAGFDKDTVTAFYNEFKDNLNIKPYLQHVKDCKGVEHKVYPYSDTNHVYIDVSEIFSGDQDVKTVSEVFTEIWNKFIEMKTEIGESIKQVKKNIEGIVKDFKSVDDIQNDLLKTLGETNQSNLEAIKSLNGEFDNLLANVEKGIRPTTFSLSHAGGTKVVPVLFTIAGNRESVEGLKELFLGSLYIVDSLDNQIAKIGSDMMMEGGTFSSSEMNLEWVTRRTAEVTMLYDVKQTSNNQFVVLMRTGIYKIFNKYIEGLKIEPKPDGFAGYTVQDVSHVYNKLVNGVGNTGPCFKRFSSAIHVTNKLAMGNGVSLKVIN